MEAVITSMTAGLTGVVTEVSAFAPVAIGAGLTLFAVPKVVEWGKRLFGSAS